MPPSARITFRLTPALEPLVADRVRQGTAVSDIVREALEQYFGLRSPGGPSPGAVLSDTATQVSDTLSDRLADMVSDVSDIQGRLAELEGRLETLASGVRHRPTARPTAAPTAAYDPTPALTRMQALRAEGRSLAQIAAALNAEGLPTRHGKPWHKGTVGYLLQSA